MTVFQFRPLHQQDLLSLCIEGERIALVSLEERHAPEILKEFTGEITRYMIPPPCDSMETALTFITTSREGMKMENDLVLAIQEKESGEFLGCCGLHPRKGSEIPDLGIWLKKSAHGNHLGQEAIHLLADWAEEHLIIHSLLYPVDKRNIASIKIAESMGGTVFGERIIESLSGKVLHELTYQIKF